MTRSSTVAPAPKRAPATSRAVRRAALALSIAGLAACASAPSPPAAAAAEPEAPAEEPPAEAASIPADDGAAESAAAQSGALVPETCAGAGGADCVPPAEWVKALCNGVYAEVALVMFRGGTPWQRRYLLGKTRAVNASGGETVEGWLSRDEEVLVLRHRKGDASGMQIGDGSGQYDALRWNGSCVSLEAGEVSSRRPSSPGQAHIEWSWLGDGIRDALRRDPALNEAFLSRKKECRGATSGSVTKACERLDAKLVARIADHVRSGAELPVPEQHP